MYTVLGDDRKSVDELMAENRDAITDAARDLGVQLGSGFGELSGGLDDIGFAIEAMAIGVNTGLSALASEVRYSNQLLASIADGIQNPKGTAARERLRWGVKHLQHDRALEAKSEFEAALQEHEYESAAWFGLGLARSQLGASPSAVADAFASCARYDDDDPARRAQAALLASSGYRDAGLSQRSTEVLSLAVRQVPSCIELAVAARRTGGDEAAFVTAATYDPERALLLATAAGLDPDELAVPVIECLSRDAGDLLAAIANAEDAVRSAELGLTSFPSLPDRPAEAAIRYGHLRRDAGRWAQSKLAEVKLRRPPPPSPEPPAPALLEAPQACGRSGSLLIALVPACVLMMLLMLLFGADPNESENYGTGWLVWACLTLLLGIGVPLIITGIRRDRLAHAQRTLDDEHAGAMREWKAGKTQHDRALARLLPAETALQRVIDLAEAGHRGKPIRPAGVL